MNRLFRGVKRSFVKCIDVDEESSELEGFCEIELNAKESADDWQVVSCARSHALARTPTSFPELS